ncbi:Ig-like domain-containing protein, partial [Hyphobacterium sp. HN65]
AILTTDQLPTGTHNITARLQTNEPNFLPSTSEAIVHDVILTVGISGPATPVSGMFDLTVSFSNEITEFSSDDIAVTNGQVVDLVAQAATASANSTASTTGSIFIASINPSSDGNVDVVIPAGAARDGNGNSNTNSAQFSVQSDLTPPAVSLTGPSDAVRDSFDIAISFSEAVSGFTLEDVVIRDAVATDFRQLGSSAYALTLTPERSPSVSISIPSAAAQDVAGNDNLASETLTVAIDLNRELAVRMPGVGEGTVTSIPAGISCETDCSANFEVDAIVQLTALAEAGSSFAGWTAGVCRGSTDNRCSVTMVDDRTVAARFTLDDPPPGRIVAATLPGARSGYVGGPIITAFLSVISQSSSPAQGCRVTSPADAPVSLNYSAVDDQNQVTGEPDPLFDIPAGGLLSFVIGLSPDEETSASGYEFLPVISCENAGLDPIVGVNSVFLTIEAAPTPDILSIGVTPSGDGIITIPSSGGVGFMAASAVNIGAGDGSAAPGEITLQTSVDTGAVQLPASLEVCRIDADAICISPRGPSVTSIMGPNSPQFFAVFARDNSDGAGISLDPASARVFLRFADATGVIRSATSAAITAPSAQPTAEIGSLPAGRWSVLMRLEEGHWPSLQRRTLFVMEDGRVIVEGGDHPYQTQFSRTSEAGVFVHQSQDGTWTTTGSIRLGEEWADQPGNFWGVRDARSADITSWFDHAGRFGANLHLSAAGELRGLLDGCAVFGQAPLETNYAMTVYLTGCELSGIYLGIIDVPANDNDPVRLIIANDRFGWTQSQATVEER